MKENKTVSPTLIIIALSFLGLLMLFLITIYFKLNPKKKEVTLTSIDQSLIIKKKDSIILDLTKEIKVLKKETSILNNNILIKNDSLIKLKNKLFYYYKPIVAKKPTTIIDKTTEK